MYTRVVKHTSVIATPVIDGEITRKAAAHLTKHDQVLAPIIERVGLCTIRPHTDYYRELVEAIIGQQLSVKAAATITKRFVALFNTPFPEPSQILEKSIDELRTAGLSRAKANYVQDLAQHIIDGTIRFDHFKNLSNQEIVAELTAVKGIGEWTAQMFLMFCMGRTNVLPTGDLGVRAGVQKLYGLSALPSPHELKDLAAENDWSPYESIASWYIWQALDNQPSAQTVATVY